MQSQLLFVFIFLTSLLFSELSFSKKEERPTLKASITTDEDAKPILTDLSKPDTYTPLENRTYVLGETVLVKWGRRWWHAKVLKTDIKTKSKKRWYVSYRGYDDTWNEWVGPARIRKLSDLVK